MAENLQGANTFLPQPPVDEPDDDTAVDLEEYVGANILLPQTPAAESVPRPDLKTSEYRLPGQMSDLGYIPITADEKPPISPVLTGESVKTIEPFFLGAGFTSKRKNILDKSKFRDEDFIVTSREAFAAAGVGEEVYRQMIMSATSFLAKDTDAPRGEDGTYPTKQFSLAALGPMSFEERVRLIEENKAQTLEFQLTTDDGRTLIDREEIPFDKITEQFNQPEKIKRYLEMNVPFIEKEDGSADLFVAGYDKQTLDALFANKFVTYFRKQGMSERNIAGVLKHRLSLKQLVPQLEDTLLGSSIAYGDKSILASAPTEALRFGVDMGTWVLGEGFEALTLWNAQLNFEGIGGYNLSTPQGREALHDRWLPRLPDTIQDHYDALGLDITYDQAEQLSRFYSSPTTALANIAVETKFTLGVARAAQTLRGAKEMQRFKLFADDMHKKYPDASPDEILLKYGAKRKQEVDVPFTDTTFTVKSSVIHDTLLYVPLVGKPLASVSDIVAKPIAFINGFRTTSALKAGFQLEDAALAVGKREEVAKFVAYRRSKIQERAAIRQRVKDSGKDITLADQTKIDELTRQIDRSKNELRRIVAMSEIPAFMRTSTKLDATVILGGAAGNIVGQNYGGDMMLWELFGSLAGMGLYGASKAGTAAVFVKDLLRGAADTRSVSMDLLNAVRLGKNMENMDPDFVAGVMARVKYFDELSAELIRAGVPAELTNKSAANIFKLSILQTLEEGMRMDLDAPGTAGFDLASRELQNISQAQGQLTAELRSLFERLGSNPQAREEGSGVKKLYDTVQAALENSENKIRQLDADMEFINNNGVEIALATIRGDQTGLANHMSPDSFENMPAVISRLKGDGVDFIDPERAAEVRQAIETTSASFSNEITATLKAVVRKALPTAQDVKKITAGVFPKAAEDGVLPLYRKPSDLFALGMENLRSTSYQNASLPYKSLNGQIFRMPGPGGQRVMGIATSDGGKLLDDIFSVMGKDENIDLLKAMNPDSVNTGSMNKLLGTLTGAAENSLSIIAAKRGVEVEVIIEAAKARAGNQLATGVPESLAVVKFMRDENAARGIDMEVFPLDFLQIKEARESLGQLSFRAGKANNKAAQADYSRLRMTADEALGSFTVTDPQGNRVNAGDLIAKVTLPDGTQVDMPVREALRVADQGWSQHMNRWEGGNPLVSTWLGTNTFKGEPRVFTGRTPDKPSGISYGNNPPPKWLDVTTWTNKDKATADRDFAFLVEAVGTPQPDGTRRIDLRTPEGRFVKESIAATYRQWIMDSMAEGKLTFKQFNEMSSKYEQLFTGIDADGNIVSLMNTNKIFRHMMEFSESSVGEIEFEKAQSLVKKAAKENAQEVSRQLRVVKSGIQTSTEFLRRYSPENLDAVKAADVLIGGGPERIALLKNHLKTVAKLSDDEISEVMRSVISEAITNRAFKATGTFTANTGKTMVGGAERLTPDYDVDINQLNSLLGINDPAVARAVEDAVGPEAYKTYKSVLAFVADEQKKLDNRVRFTGIPRAFSVESYISRFYAINRGVVSFRYVGTEAVLQQMRNRNMSMLTQIIQNPKVGELFMEMVRTGKPLPFEKEKQMFQMLSIGLERYNATHQPEPFRIRTGTGFEFTFGKPTDTMNIGRNIRSKAQMIEMRTPETVKQAQELFRQSQN